MNDHALLLLALALPTAACGATVEREDAPTQPNVVVILADDLGYGDTNAYGADPTHLRTPNLDRLAREGLRFTNAYSGASCCSPSRYALLTGELAFRNPRAQGVMTGNAAASIDPGRTTLATVFQDAGYATGFVGKWHLGLGDPAPDWNGALTPGPIEAGFDECFYFPGTGDRVPCVWVRDHHVVGLDPADPIEVDYEQNFEGEPTGAENPELLTLPLVPGHGHTNSIVHGTSRIGFARGGVAAQWVDEEMSDTIAREAVGFLERHQDEPFLLYVATHGIHEPKIPHERFLDSSGSGIYGDQVHELDDAVGQVLDALDRLDLARDTLVLFTSDNGGTDWIAYDYGERNELHGHAPNGALRGEKFTHWEGGSRVPWMVRWPALVEAGTESDAVVGLVDVTASMARLVGTEIPEGQAPDSVDVLDALLGVSPTGREEFVGIQSGRNLFVRRGDWKWVPARRQQPGQLFDLASDPAETTDVSDEHPELAAALDARLKAVLEGAPAR